MRCIQKGKKDMYERMLNKQQKPTPDEMKEHCRGMGEYFTMLNAWLTAEWGTEGRIVFPYGNKYGWGMAHHRKNKLVCNAFAEAGSFTVMVRLTNRQCAEVYPHVGQAAQRCIDGKYPCGDGGWLHYRVTCEEEYADARRILSVKCE